MTGGFCFLSYHCFWHVFQLGNTPSAESRGGKKRSAEMSIAKARAGNGEALSHDISCLQYDGSCSRQQDPAELLLSRGSRVLFAGQFWHTLHLRARQKASLEVEAWRSAPLSCQWAPLPPLTAPPLSTLPPSPPLCHDHCPAHPSAQGDNGSLWKKSRKKEERGVTELPVCWQNL